jgi:hypothetical protein
MLAFSGASRREIALRADLRFSRLERILGGYVAPARDEITLIARACKADPSLVTTPHARGAGGLPTRTVLGLLLSDHVDQRAALGDLDPRVSLSVDKLSVSFNADETKLLAVARVGRLVRPKRSLYRVSYQLGRVFVQHGRSPGASLKHKRRSSRVEFNPARARDLDWKLVRRVLALAEDVRVTRLDVAADLPVSPARLQVLAERAKLHSISSPVGIETIYVGARKSGRRQVALYDKRREQIDAGRADENHPELTRVEARLGYRWLKGGLAELRHLGDPFADLALVDLSASDLTGLHLLGASYASSFGVQALRSLGVAPADIAAIAPHVDPSDPLHPSRVYADEWPRVVSRLLRRLRVS